MTLKKEGGTGKPAIGLQGRNNWEHDTERKMRRCSGCIDEDSELGKTNQLELD